MVLPVSLVLIVSRLDLWPPQLPGPGIPLLLFTGCYFLLGVESGGCGAAGGGVGCCLSHCPSPWLL